VEVSFEKEKTVSTYGLFDRIRSVFQMGLQLSIDDPFPSSKNMNLEPVVHQPFPVNPWGKPGRAREILRMEAVNAYHAE
jgi:hypothetical protein